MWTLLSSEQMLTLDKNPFAWNERGNISGMVGALSLVAEDGSLITVEDLSEDIEVSCVATTTAEDSEGFICRIGSSSVTIVWTCIYFALFPTCSVEEFMFSWKKWGRFHVTAHTAASETSCLYLNDLDVGWDIFDPHRSWCRGLLESMWPLLFWTWETTAQSS